VGSWLITYVCEDDVEKKWKDFERETRAEARSHGEVRAVL